MRNPYSGWAALLYNRLANRGGYDPVDLTSHGLPSEYNPPDATVDSTPPSANPLDPSFKKSIPTEKGGTSFGLSYTPGMPVGSVNSRGAIFAGFMNGKPVFVPQSTSGSYGSGKSSGIVGGSGLGGYGAGGSNSGMFSGVSTSSGFGTGIGIGFGGAVQGGGPWPVKKY